MIIFNFFFSKENFDRFLVCPETHPHVYTYVEENDSCCAGAVDIISNLDYCYHDSDYCAHDPPCDSHPSVVDDGKGKRFIKNKLDGAHFN